MIRKKQRLLPKVNNDGFDILGDGISCSIYFCNNNAPFSTFDNDNDGSPTANNAVKWRGAWWYHDGHMSNLNGEYGNIGPLTKGGQFHYLVSE